MTPTPNLPESVVTDEMVERAITAAMKECRIEGVGLTDKRWDTLFPSKAAWRSALEAVITDGCATYWKEQWRAANARAEGADADARRYRWLRECSAVRSDRAIYINQAVYLNGEFRGSIEISRERLDSEIDAAQSINTETDHGS